MGNHVSSFGTATNGYRSDGMRAWKQVGSGSKTYFLYDGGNPVLELNSSATVTAINTFGSDGLVARQSGGNWTYYTFDVQGNVAVRQNSDGTIQSRSTFDAYGQETSTGSPSDPYAYNGQWGYYLDRETGLYLCQHRYYDPANGRWLNRDPIGYAGGANLYGYCGGGPVAATDPTGLEVVLILMGAVVDEGERRGDEAWVRRRVAEYHKLGYTVRVLRPGDMHELDAELAENDLKVVEVVAHGGVIGTPSARLSGRKGSPEKLSPTRQSSTVLTPERIRAQRKGKSKLERLILAVCEQGSYRDSSRRWQNAAEETVLYSGKTSVSRTYRGNPVKRVSNFPHEMQVTYF